MTEGGLAAERWRRSVVMVTGLIFLRFLKQICLLGLLRGDRVGSSIEMALWSDTPRSCSERLLMEVDLVINKSRVWPLECVGTLTCWVRLRLSRRLRNSEEFRIQNTVKLS